MRGLGTTFAGYQLEHVVLTDAVSVTYRATMDRELSTVYRGVSSTLSRPVLLRITDPLHEPDADEHAAAFLQRIRTAALVEHPAVIKAIDTGYVDGRVYIATRWTGGLTLEEQIRRDGRMEPHTAYQLLRPVADGLDTLHAAGVIHGAISPRTLWIDESRGAQGARITSFGLDTSLHGLDVGGTGDSVLSDAFYVAPEQFRGAPAGPGADQYALACTLYHCIGGRPPYSSVTAAVRSGALEPALPVFDFSAEEIPNELRAAIAVGMADQPQRRHASCVALIRAAQSSSNGTAVRAPASAQTPPVRDAKPRRGVFGTAGPLRLSWPVAALLALVALAIALIVTTILRSGGQVAATVSVEPAAIAHAGDVP